MHPFLFRPVVHAVADVVAVGLVDDYPLLDDIVNHLIVSDLNPVDANPLSNDIYDVEHHSSMQPPQIRMLCIAMFH